MRYIENYEEKLLPPSTISRLCSVDKSWLIEQAAAGKIPAVKSNGKYAFHLPTVKAILLDIAKGKGGAK
jgi:hypothetical protein